MSGCRLRRTARIRSPDWSAVGGTYTSGVRDLGVDLALVSCTCRTPYSGVQGAVLAFSSSQCSVPLVGDRPRLHALCRVGDRDLSGRGRPNALALDPDQAAEEDRQGVAARLVPERVDAHAGVHPRPAAGTPGTSRPSTARRAACAPDAVLQTPLPALSSWPQLAKSSRAPYRTRARARPRARRRLPTSVPGRGSTHITP